MPLPTATPNCSGVSRPLVWFVVARSDGDAAISRKGKRLPRRPDYYIIRVRLSAFPSRGSTFRSDCRPHSGRNDVIKPNEHVAVLGDGREIPCGRNGTKHTRASPLACGRNGNSRTRMRRDEGVPPYRRLSRFTAFPLGGATRRHEVP